MSDLGWNIWGAVGGAIGTLLAVVPLFIIWMHARLPSKQLPGLLALLEETKELFVKAVREGALNDAQEIQQIEFSMATASVHVNDFRATVYAATSYWQDVKNWWNGVSCGIADLYDVLNGVRVRLVKPGSLERKMLKELDAGFSVCTSIPDHTLLPPPEYTSEPPPAHPLPPHPTRAEAPPPAASTLRDTQVTSLLRHNTETSEGARQATLPSHSRPDHPPTYHVISDSDLQGLLSLAAAQLLLRKEQRKRQRAARNAVLRHFSQQLQGSSTLIFPKRHTNPARLRTLVHRVRHTYGARQAGAGSDDQSADVDPQSSESLSQSAVDDQGCDNVCRCKS